jgi:transcriptional regulator with XRE-family HTH domain
MLRNALGPTRVRSSWMGRGKRPNETGSEVSALRMSVGKNVKSARELADLSQRDLCAKTGISQSYLSQVERGTWNIGLDNIARIARAVGIAPHLLLHPSFARGSAKPLDSITIKIADAPTKAKAPPSPAKGPSATSKPDAKTSSKPGSQQKPPKP